MSFDVHTIDLNFLGQKHGIAAFLVETSEGPILVETGPHSTLPILQAALQSYGYALEDITKVFLTHIHLDHAGAAWCFADTGATIYVHPKGYKHLHDPKRLLSSAQRIYGEMMDTLWGTLRPIPSDQLVATNHLESISLGDQYMISHHTPGHAIHHISWQLGSVLFTGDVAGVCIDGGPVIPPCPPPDIHREDWLSSIDLIASLSEVNTYFLTHFGQVSASSDHLDRLKNSLESYMSFVKPHAYAGRSAEEILPAFTTFVKEHLIDQGLDPATAQAYEAANPSSMSIYGLMRYWQKRIDEGA